MYFDQARTRSAIVTWYWAPEGATPLPFPHRFGSETWDEVHYYGGEVGEDYATGSTYAKGTMPGPFTGNGGFCGKEEWWRNGAPSDAPALARLPSGLPRCCFGRDGVTGGYSLGYAPGWDRFRRVP